jgi:hypothetical protein
MPISTVQSGTDYPFVELEVVRFMMVLVKFRHALDFDVIKRVIGLLMASATAGTDGTFCFYWSHLSITASPSFWYRVVSSTI